MGNVNDVRRLVDAGRWLVVLLWVSREMCERRSRERGDDDTAERLRVWAETLADLHAHDDSGLFACRFQTDEITSAKVARLVAWILADRQTAASASATPGRMVKAFLASKAETLDADFEADVAAAREAIDNEVRGTWPDA